MIHNVSVFLGKKAHMKFLYEKKLMLCVLLISHILRRPGRNQKTIPLKGLGCLKYYRKFGM
jgi:hypothetical protein